MEHQLAETNIRNLIDNRVQAIKNRDAESASKNYSSDVVLFDVVGPLELKDPGSIKTRLKEWLATFQDDAPVDFEMASIYIKADTTIAFSHSFNHINTVLKDGNQLNMWWRETQNWENINGEWLVTHTHSSVPFDAKIGKPSLDLKPDQDGTT